MKNGRVEARAPKSPRSARVAGAGLFTVTAAVALVVGAGCATPIDRVDFRLDTTPPRGVTVSAERIEIEHGIAVGVTALPKSEGESVDYSVSLSPTDPTLFGVESVIGNQFIFYGTFPGSCTLQITTLGSSSTSGQVDIPVRVIEQGL